jgi:hypothetical protein
MRYTSVAVTDERRTPDVSLTPRAVWIAFIVLSLLIPLVGFWLEGAR